jgi:hypothetical protein
MYRDSLDQIILKFASPMARFTSIIDRRTPSFTDVGIYGKVRYFEIPETGEYIRIQARDGGEKKITISAVVVTKAVADSDPAGDAVRFLLGVNPAGGMQATVSSVDEIERFINGVFSRYRPPRPHVPNRWRRVDGGYRRIDDGKFVPHKDADGPSADGFYIFKLGEGDEVALVKEDWNIVK